MGIPYLLSQNTLNSKALNFSLFLLFIFIYVLLVLLKEKEKAQLVQKLKQSYKCSKKGESCT